MIEENEEVNELVKEKAKMPLLDLISAVIRKRAT